MKTRFYFLGILIAAIVSITSCENENVQPKNADNGILPDRFSVDIPSALTGSASKSANLKSAESDDTLKGNAIYNNLRYFIAIGEGSAKITEAIITFISVYKIENVIELTYTSDDDNRIKKLVVESNVDYDSRNWEYQLTITDVESEGNADGGKGMQVFWNNSPIEGISLIKPYNLDRSHNGRASDAMFKLEYSEAGMGIYEAYMIIEIAGLPLANAINDPYSVDNIKMFVGKQGEVVDVYGNSNHPNAKFFTDSTGFNWAFVASGIEEQHIGVAEVGLPPCSLDATTREVLLEDYSIQNVFTNQINSWFVEKFGIHPDSSDLAAYLHNTEAPGYFNANGFVQAGTSPGTEYSAIELRIKELAPYNPKSINDLMPEFKE